MKQIVYVSDSMKEAVNFINGLISDLQQLGIDNIKHDKEHNFIIVGNTEIRGIGVYENFLCTKIHDTEYFIDGIDMRKYKNASNRQIDSLIYHIKETMSHFRENTKQLENKDELIKILTRNNAEASK